MWFPVDEGMINLERVAFIRVTEGFEISFYNDHRAQISKATFESKDQLRGYLEKLKSELPYPVEPGDRERFPSPERGRGGLLEPGVSDGGEDSS